MSQGASDTSSSHTDTGSRDRGGGGVDRVGDATRRGLATARPALSSSARSLLTQTSRQSDRLLRSSSMRSDRALTPTNTSSGNQRSTEDPDFPLYGESMASLDTRFLSDVVPPPELSRPEPATLGDSRTGEQLEVGGPINVTEWSCSPRRSRLRTSLTNVMNEQRQEAEKKIRASERVYIEKMEDIRSADDAREEALLQIAMERSLRSLNDKSVHSHRSSMNRSFSSDRESDFIRDMQMEADRTEQVIFDSPHPANNFVASSSRRSINGQPSRDSLSRSSSIMSMRSAGSLSPSASGHQTNTANATATTLTSATASTQRIPRSSSNSPASSFHYAVSPTLSPKHRSRSLGNSPHQQKSLLSNARSLSTSPAEGISRPVVLRGTMRRQPSSNNNNCYVTADSTTTTEDMPNNTSAANTARSYSLSSASQSQQAQPQLSGSGMRSRSMGSRQQSIRIGPLPGNMLVGEDGLIIHDDASAEALLEMARQNLSPTEVTLLERALKKSILIKQQQQQQQRPGVGGGGGSSSASGARTRASRTGPISSSLKADSRHSATSETSTASDDCIQQKQQSLTQEELNQIDMALRHESEDIITVAPKSPSAPAYRPNLNTLLKESHPVTPGTPATKKSFLPAQVCAHNLQGGNEEAGLNEEKTAAYLDLDDDVIAVTPKSPSRQGYRPYQTTPFRNVPPPTTPVTPATYISSPVGDTYDLRGAEANLSEEELRQIHQALLESAEEEESSAAAVARAAAVVTDQNDPHGISEADAAAIARALREAEEEEEMRNFRLALQMHREEEERVAQQAAAARRQPQGNVRTMTRAEVEAESRVGAFQAIGPTLVGSHYYCNTTMNHEQPELAPIAAGFRMNSNARHEWVRRDQNSIVGPNNEVRTKHDTTLAGQTNAHRLGLEEDEYGSMAHVGNAAYNSFMQSVRRTRTKGVAAHGTGRAGSDADATRGGAMDSNVRLLISRAINNGYIDRCNGAVKEGKEAILYHGERGDESGGFDVAIKVFKRIQDFKGRGDYVDGDPRYANENFRRISAREQLELWTEKEFRNLVRANRGGVSVPTPLFHKDNVLFMRFLGTDGWPAPQLKEIDIRHGSKKWDVLYTQVMDGVRKLYRNGRLVHGDLSEYNILAVPAFLVENVSPGVENVDEELQAVLIDFGQAVDIRHPDAIILLQQDLDRVKSFFTKQGVETMGAEEALVFVVDDGAE